MIIWSTIVATVISTVAIWLASLRNNKRRRSAGLKKVETRALFQWSLLAISLAPGLVLIGMSNVSGFICWFAALTVTGWFVAVRRPAPN